jgi:hypothetical protein
MPGPSNGEESRSSLVWSEGVFVAMLTLLGYGMAFAYETGYATYFRIPVESNR